jgi:hypothetical protein
MTRQWWFLFFLMVFADGPASIFIWWRLWQWRRMAGLSGWMAAGISLLAAGHGLHRLCGIIAWFQPLKGFNPWQTAWSWSGEILLSAPLWALGFILFWDYRTEHKYGRPVIVTDK